MTPDFFEDDDHYTGPPIDRDAIRQAEESLGFRLPAAYIDLLLNERNGGVPKRRCVATQFPTSWAPDHFEVSALLGIGGDWGIDPASGLGSAELIGEWGYPDIGIVLFDTPSAGHDTVMLDYSECGPRGEPAVVYVDEDRVPRRVAESFADFIDRLAPCPEPEF